MTWKELDCKARAIGALLQRTIGAGERALLLYPAGLDFIAGFFGSLYAGVVAVPAYPPDPSRVNRTLSRLQAILVDAEASVVLTTTSILSLAKPLLAQAPDLARLNWLATDAVNVGARDEWNAPTLTGDTLAFLQYTSGSTGTPKGVMLTHNNLLHNAWLVYSAFEQQPDDKFVSWLPTFHDMGFMAGILEPLYAGIPSILMSPLASLQNPFLWLRAISDYKATTSGAPNFAYDLCVRKITDEQRATLDLSSWTVAFNGSEPIRPETLKRSSDAFEPCNFRPESFHPCYGLAEATLIVSGGRKHAKPVIRHVETKQLGNNRAVVVTAEGESNHTLVGCGGSLRDQKIVIVNPESLSECRPEQVGEIWVSGPSISRGYWNRIEETEHTFYAAIARTGEGPFLRTGDLGFIQDGELFITGRLKDLIIIRGRNHYPQDIELTVEQSHSILRPGCGAAFSVEVAGEERLVVVQEVARHEQVDLGALIETIRQVITKEHELQAYAVALIKPGSIPKTSSGKIQRRACRDRFLSSKLEVVESSILETAPDASWDRHDLSRQALLAVESEERQPMLELHLREEVAGLLGINTSIINARHPLTSAGIDSLAAVELKNLIEVTWGVNVPLVDFLQEMNIAQLATRIVNELTDSAPTLAIAAAEKPPTEYPLAFGQQALWFLQQLAPDNPAYNIGFATRIWSDLHPTALRRIFQILVDRHPSLRATFSAPLGEPIQRIDQQAEVCFYCEDASTWSDELLNARLTEEVRQPFNLEQGPVLRASLFTRSSGEYILAMTVHHIAMDFWSFVVLMDEFRLLHAAEKSGGQASLPDPVAHLSNYVSWQADLLSGVEGERLWAYWQEQLAGELPVLSLPTDQPRPPMQTYRGASRAFRFDPALSRALKELAQAQGATLYMVLLAAFEVLLSRYTGQEDILVGSPTAGRSRAEFDSVLGYFMNPVVLRANFFWPPHVPGISQSGTPDSPGRVGTSGFPHTYAGRTTQASLGCELLIAVSSDVCSQQATQGSAKRTGVVCPGSTGRAYRLRRLKDGIDSFESADSPVRPGVEYGRSRGHACRVAAVQC